MIQIVGTNNMNTWLTVLATLFLTFFKVDNKPILTFVIKALFFSFFSFFSGALLANNGIDFTNVITYKLMFLSVFFGFFVIGIMEILDWYKRKEELELERQEKMSGKKEDKN